MARPEVTGKKISTATVAPVVVNDADVLSVDDFCRRHRISRQVFYRRIAEMPATFTIGVRRYITREAAARWRREREQAAAENNA
jgi:hypothetical protein